MLNCKDITELLTEYLEGEMTLLDRMRVRTHLLMCPPCRRYADQLALTIASCGHLPEPEVDEGLEQALLETFRNWKVHDGAT